MSVFYWIGFGVMAVAAIVAMILNRRLRKLLDIDKDLLETDSELIERLREKNKELNDLISLMAAQNLDLVSSTHNPAEVEELEDYSMFHVYRMGGDTKFTVKRVPYDSTDPDDRDYKRIHAEEVVEILNEQP